MLQHQNLGQNRFNLNITAGVPAPLQVGSLAGWFKLDNTDTDIVESGGEISIWKDASGNGNDVIQNNAAHKPTLVPNVLRNIPCVRFDGSDFLQALLPSNSPSGRTSYHIFAVASVSTVLGGGSSLVAFTGPVSPGQEAISLELNHTNDEVRFIASTDTTGLIAASLEHNPPLLTDELIIAEGSIDVTRTLNEILVYKNGSINAGQGGIPGTSLIGGASLRLGSSRDTLIKPLNGDMVEVLIYDEELTQDERQFIAAYLSFKFSVALEP